MFQPRCPVWSVIVRCAGRCGNRRAYWPRSPRWWLENERRIVRPRVIVALGATAALSVFGKPMPVAKSRQQALQLPDQAQGVVTYHPSFLLRVPDADAKAKAFADFVSDLKFAWRLAA